MFCRPAKSILASRVSDSLTLNAAPADCLFGQQFRNKVYHFYSRTTSKIGDTKSRQFQATDKLVPQLTNENGRHMFQVGFNNDFNLSIIVTPEYDITF